MLSRMYATSHDDKMVPFLQFSALQPLRYTLHSMKGDLAERKICSVQLIERISDRRCLVGSFLHTESRFNKLLRTFPLYAVVHERTGLLGTREYAIRLMGQPSLIKAT